MNSILCAITIIGIAWVDVKIQESQSIWGLFKVFSSIISRIIVTLAMVTILHNIGFTF